MGARKNEARIVAAKIASRLVGHRLIGVEHPRPVWVFRFADDVELRVECYWRVLVKGRLALGDIDHGQKFGLPEPIDGVEESKNLLLKKTIQGVVIREDTGDLTIAFSHQTALEIVNSSSGYEGWQLADNTGLLVVAMGGGGLAYWSGCSEPTDSRRYAAPAMNAFLQARTYLSNLLRRRSDRLGPAPTAQQAAALKSYVTLLKDFVDGNLSPATFESTYLEKFKSETTMLPESAFSVLDRLFADVDAYNADPSLRGPDGIGDEQLISAAKNALSKLAKVSMD